MTTTEEPPINAVPEGLEALNSKSTFIAVVAVLILATTGFLMWPEGKSPTTQAAAAIDTIVQPNVGDKAKKSIGDASEKNVSPAERKLPLRPLPNGLCADNTDNWCGKRLGHAAMIVDVGMRETNLPKRAWIIAVATAMQESTLDNLATDRYPVTKQFPFERTGADHDSVGIMQQRPSQGWGTPEELMDPRIAAKKFYNALAKKVKNWDGWEDPERVRLTDIAQRVQNSGYPEAYQKHEATATKIVNLVLKYQYTPEFHKKDSRNKWFVMFQCENPKSKDCRMVRWELIKPIVDNRDAFSKRFPKAELNGNIGDWRHQNADTPQDHTSAADICHEGSCNKLGWVYAQDFGNGDTTRTGFDPSHFTHWLLDELRAHPDKYPVKYVISRIPKDKGSAYYGEMNRKRGWSPVGASGHESHVHISYMPGFEREKSTMMADYIAFLDGGANKPAVAPVSGAAAGFPLFYRLIFFIKYNAEWCAFTALP